MVCDFMRCPALSNVGGREGVKEHGKGYWKKIKESFQALENRSAVGLPYVRP
jgi:hypothetical protein